MAIPIVRPGFGDDLLPRAVADFIFEKTTEMSVTMQLAPEEPLAGSGKAIPVITGKPSAGWVSEGGRKPVSDMTVASKTMDPKKLAVIVPFSKEYLRDERVNLFGMLRPKIAEAFAAAFDAATMAGTSTPFANYLLQTTNSVEIGTATQANGGIYKDLVNAMGTVVAEGKNYRVNGWAADYTAETLLLGATDTTGRPIFNADANVGIFGGSLLSRPVYYGENVGTPVVTGTPNTGGVQMIGGDWSQARYGVASDIAYSLSDQASIVLADGTTTLNLWQDNLVALLAEAEFGFVVNDVEAFVQVTDNT